MSKKRIAVIVSLALIMSMTVFEPTFARTSNSSKKTVYAVSSWTMVEKEYDRSAKKYEGKRAKITLDYTKNGLLKTIKAKDKLNAYPDLQGKPKWTYKGKRLIKVVNHLDNGTYTTTCRYKKDKLKSMTVKWKSQNPVATYYYVKNGKQAEKDIYDTHSKTYKLKLNSRGRVLYGNHSGYNDKGYITNDTAKIDEHGFIAGGGKTIVTEKYIKKYMKAPYADPDRYYVGEILEGKTVNTYDKKGRLLKTVWTRYEDGKLIYKKTITFKYKKQRIPSNYYNTFKTQQYDIMREFAISNGDPTSTLIGFGKVG